jgi:hypothetical protein
VHEIGPGLALVVAELGGHLHFVFGDGVGSPCFDAGDGAVAVELGEPREVGLFRAGQAAVGVSRVGHHVVSMSGKAAAAVIRMPLGGGDGAWWGRVSRSASSVRAPLCRWRRNLNCIIFRLTESEKRFLV